MPSTVSILLTFSRRRTVLEQLEHLALDVDGDHLAALADQLGQLERIKPVAAAHVADGVARLDVECLQQRCAILLALAGLARQPRRTEIVHRLRDLAALVLLERPAESHRLAPRQYPM